MPYVDYMSKGGDWASFWYHTNSIFDNVGGFDPKKPTILMLHPLFLDCTWLHFHFEDSRIRDDYNIISIDNRLSGRSRCRPSSLHDCYVDAADLALVHQRLQLPPAHVFACETQAVNAALAFAALFPELCLSLTLLNVPPPTELQYAFNAYEELLQQWCFPEDLDVYENAGSEASAMVAGPDVPSELKDDLIRFWTMTMPPSQRLRVLEAVNLIMNRVGIEKPLLKDIKQPVLIIQSESNAYFPRKYADILAKQLTSVPNGALVYVVKGSTGSLTLVPNSVSIVNQVFAKFLSRMPRRGSALKPIYEPPEDAMAAALDRLAGVVDNPKIATRDPLSALSFSLVKEEIEKAQLESLQFYIKDLQNAFSPLTYDGKPIRNYSDKKKDGHWFHDSSSSSETSSDSASESPVVVRKVHSSRNQSMSQAQTPASRPVTAEMIVASRNRRATLNPNVVDQHVLKGSMQKLASTGGAPLTKLMSWAADAHASIQSS